MLEPALISALTPSSLGLAGYALVYRTALTRSDFFYLLFFSFHVSISLLNDVCGAESVLRGQKLLAF